MMLQEHLDQMATNSTTASPPCEDRPSSSNCRLNSAQRFRRMISDSRITDHDHAATIKQLK